jgi:hypothetical protein
MIDTLLNLLGGILELGSSRFHFSGKETDLLLHQIQTAVSFIPHSQQVDNDQRNQKENHRKQ